jgi:hypothetical protein
VLSSASFQELTKVLMWAFSGAFAVQLPSPSPA